MNSKVIRDEGQTLAIPTGKVLGIVDTREDFEALIQTMTKAGFGKVQALFGEDGISLLERVDGFFFSDMEDRVLQRHIDELKAGRFIVAIETAGDQVDEVVRVASQNGARRLVHFGPWRVTWHTK